LLTVMRDETADRHTRVDAAKAAAPFVHPRMGQADPNKTIDPDFVPLAERLKAYAKRDAEEAEKNNVVKLPRSAASRYIFNDDAI
jgi:hypothetical protein